MAKKTLALAFFLLSACVLSAAECVPGIRFMSGASYCALERAESVSIDSSVSLDLLTKRTEKVGFTVSLGMESAQSLLNLSRFSSAGDYKGLFIKAGLHGSFLSFDAGVLLVMPEPYGGSVIPVFAMDAVFFKDANLGEDFVLRVGAGASVALGRSFKSYTLVFGVMGLWR